ncbi:hypothetical protein CSKR_202940 [Clonorchis sinensis]|uniref:Uncharacterized protein n=1 Tax=Clonorchis sinensis TaxID=79923 RepID=A0A8T1M435_CLOSI|nr:hypothetical protein CSKR_202940 [Clonorchis sinensis]
MESSNLPLLFWELVERRLRSSDHYEARLLVGNDLIEQTYELKTEIVSFIALMKDGRVVKQAFQVSFPKFSRVAGIESHLDKFIRFYQKEHYSHSERGLDDDDDSPSVAEDSLSILSETRAVLQEEVKALMEYLNQLQESLLMNFTHPAEPEGDCVLGESKEAPVLVIQHGDGKAATREIQKERKSKRRTSLTTGQTVEVSRASSISNSSANSSASVSPRSGADVKLKPPSTSSSISADLDISASYRHRTKETLSASSRTLCQNGSPGLSPRSKRSPSQSRISPAKSGVIFPPLVKNKNPTVNDSSINGTQKHSSFFPIRISQGPAVTGRFNSAQRFRQMVLQTRQYLASARTPGSEQPPE